MTSAAFRWINGSFLVVISSMMKWEMSGSTSEYGSSVTCFSPWKKRVVLGVVAANTVPALPNPEILISSLSCVPLCGESCEIRAPRAKVPGLLGRWGFALQCGGSCGKGDILVKVMCYLMLDVGSESPSNSFPSCANRDLGFLCQWLMHWCLSCQKAALPQELWGIIFSLSVPLRRGGVVQPCPEAGVDAGRSCFCLNSCYLKEQHDKESWRLLGLNTTCYVPNKLVFPPGLL